MIIYSSPIEVCGDYGTLEKQQDFLLTLETIIPGLATEQGIRVALITSKFERNGE